MDYDVAYILEKYDDDPSKNRTWKSVKANVGFGTTVLAKYGTELFTSAFKGLVVGIQKGSGIYSDMEEKKVKEQQAELKKIIEKRKEKINNKILNCINEMKKAEQENKWTYSLMETIKGTFNDIITYVINAGKLFTKVTAGFTKSDTEEVNKHWTVLSKMTKYTINSSLSIGAILAIVYVIHKIIKKIKNKNTKQITDELKNGIQNVTSVAKKNLKDIKKLKNIEKIKNKLK